MFFMISMKDHFQSDSTPNAMPLTSALKGTSMNNNQALLMIKMVKKKLYESQIPVLCYCFDGQWRNCVMQDNAGNPLTHLQINSCIWDHVSKMSVEHILHDMTSVGRLKQGDKDLISFSHKLEIGDVLSGLNIEILCSDNGLLSCITLGGDIFTVPALTFFNSIPTWPKKTWEEDEEENEEETSTDTNVKSKVYGLCCEEENLLSVVDADILVEIRQQWEDVQQVEIDNDDYLPDIKETPSQLAALLGSKEFMLLEDITSDLQELNNNKWSTLTPDALFPDMLQDASVPYKNCTIKDLVVIGKVMECYTGRPWYNHKISKACNVNMIVEAFDSKNFLAEWDSQK